MFSDGGDRQDGDRLVEVAVDSVRAFYGNRLRRGGGDRTSPAGAGLAVIV